MTAAAGLAVLGSGHVGPVIARLAIKAGYAANLRAPGATGFDLKYGMPGLTHEQQMANTELYGRKVIPRARDLLS